ncbi:hypothetical protein AS361_01680 [Myroides marinus]|uniref:hypothetical protein n=1 Tax=Myroides marinus TaxID=703342 RepID=UPI000741ED74|nr:hypothetical protein [Myroides marinus]KUF39315.1 hypothetical protein AS361_01680 [Myroides marinus]
MNKYLLVLLCAIFSISAHITFASNPKKEAAQWKYDIECAGTGSEGTFLVKIWTYSNKGTIPNEEAKKNAVHGVLFRGFAANGVGCVSQRPLIKDASVQHEKVDYFNSFFGKESPYLKYATISSSVPEVVKISKKEYKVGYVVSVSKDLLRKDLEVAGIVKSLSAGF